MRALILVDIQNDFLPGGALAVPDGDAVITLANKLQPLFPIVVATQDWHPPNHGSFAANHPGKEPYDQIDLEGVAQTLWPVHCVQGTPGAALPSGLTQTRITKVFQKGTDPRIDSYSGFFDNGHRKATGLGEWLKEQGVTETYVCGLATDYCVRFTALDAVQLGFKTYLIEDACRGVNLRPDDASHALEELKRAGVLVVQGVRLLSAWKQPIKSALATGKFLSLVREGHWEYAERVNATGAAVIVALTDENKLLLVEQYRIPVHSQTIELPAGIIGDDPGVNDESQAEAARRELLEETGFRAERIEVLTTGPASSGLTSETITLFRASGLKRVAAGGGVAQEDITVHEVPLAEVHNWLEATQAKSGVLIDPKIYAGLYFVVRTK